MLHHVPPNCACRLNNWTWWRWVFFIRSFHLPVYAFPRLVHTTSRSTAMKERKNESTWINNDVNRQDDDKRAQADGWNIYNSLNQSHKVQISLSFPLRPPPTSARIFHTTSIPEKSFNSGRKNFHPDWHGNCIRCNNKLVRGWGEASLMWKCFIYC